MVKFSKELEAQLIPEWKDKYVDYKLLKKPIKKIKLLRLSQSHSSVNDAVFGRSIFDPFRTLSSKISGCFQSSAGTSHSSRSAEGDCEGGHGDGDDDDLEYGYRYDEEGVARCELVHLFSEEEEVSNFMEMIEEELVKVDEFYQMKEAEMVAKGETLNKQLQLLLSLKQVFSVDRSRHRRDLILPSPNSSGRVSGGGISVSEASVGTEMEMAKQAEVEEVMEALERMEMRSPGAGGIKSSKMKKGKAKAMSTLRIDIPNGDRLSVNSPIRGGVGDSLMRKKVQVAEKMIRGAFVEFYKALCLLKSYRSLNLVAFTKIMKKFDKVANRQESAAYLKRVKEKQFVSSDKVVRQRDEVETLFVEHFADNDRKKAMKFLKPHLHHPDSHFLSFLVGLFTGSFITLFALYAVLAHLSGLFSPTQTKAGYMDTVYPVFSMFALMSLHLFMYGCNLFMWKATRTNHIFVFDFESRTALTHKDAFLVSTFFMTVVITALIIHLLLKFDGFPPAQIDTLPSILFLVSIALLICPFKTFYHPTRYYFLRVMRNIVFSPFSKVLFVDIFMADQLTSQIPLLRHVETTICYFLASTFRTHDFETCQSGKLYTQLAYVISFSPYYWRAMQCGRRWLDESDASHLVNLGKYVSAMVAAGARLTYAQQPDSKLWLVAVVVTSVIATMYQLYWDFKRDWGVMNVDSKNAWLRDSLILKRSSVYYIAMGVNVTLRVAWVESVLKLRVGRLESRMLDFSMASLEVIRRGHWNFYRVENEHLNNAGKFRAEKNVPLPFRETDSND